MNTCQAICDRASGDNKERLTSSSTDSGRSSIDSSQNGHRDPVGDRNSDAEVLGNITSTTATPLHADTSTCKPQSALISDIEIYEDVTLIPRSNESIRMVGTRYKRSKRRSVRTKHTKTQKAKETLSDTTKLSNTVLHKCELPPQTLGNSTDTSLGEPLKLKGNTLRAEQPIKAQQSQPHNNSLVLSSARTSHRGSGKEKGFFDSRCVRAKEQNVNRNVTKQDKNRFPFTSNTCELQAASNIAEHAVVSGILKPASEEKIGKVLKDLECQIPPNFPARPADQMSTSYSPDSLSTRVSFFRCYPKKIRHKATDVTFHESDRQSSLHLRSRSDDILVRKVSLIEDDFAKSMCSVEYNVASLTVAHSKSKSLSTVYSSPHATNELHTEYQMSKQLRRQATEISAYSNSTISNTSPSGECLHNSSASSALIRAEQVCDYQLNEAPHDSSLLPDPCSRRYDCKSLGSVKSTERYSRQSYRWWKQQSDPTQSVNSLKVVTRPQRTNELLQSNFPRKCCEDEVSFQLFEPTLLLSRQVRYMGRYNEPDEGRDCTSSKFDYARVKTGTHSSDGLHTFATSFGEQQRQAQPLPLSRNYDLNNNRKHFNKHNREGYVNTTVSQYIKEMDKQNFGRIHVSRSRKSDDNLDLHKDQFISSCMQHSMPIPGLNMQNLAPWAVLILTSDNLLRNPTIFPTHRINPPDSVSISPAYTNFYHNDCQTHSSPKSVDVWPMRILTYFPIREDVERFMNAAKGGITSSMTNVSDSRTGISAASNEVDVFVKAFLETNLKKSDEESADRIELQCSKILRRPRNMHSVCHEEQPLGHLPANKESMDVNHKLPFSQRQPDDVQVFTSTKDAHCQSKTTIPGCAGNGVFHPQIDNQHFFELRESASPSEDLLMCAQQPTSLGCSKSAATETPHATLRKYATSGGLRKDNKMAANLNIRKTSDYGPWQTRHNMPSVIRQKKHSSKTNLYIRGLPDAFTEDQLHTLAPDKELIRSVKLITGSEGETYGFIDFVTNAAAKSALLHIKTTNRELYVNFAYESEKDPQNVYITNIPETWTANNVEDLKRIFQPYGQISTAIVMTNRTSNFCTGAGFVRFVRTEDAQRAIEGIRDAKITVEGAGRPLEVKLADRQRPSNDHSGTQRSSRQSKERLQCVNEENRSERPGESIVSQGYKIQEKTTTSCLLPDDTTSSMLTYNPSLSSLQESIGLRHFSNLPKLENMGLLPFPRQQTFINYPLEATLSSPPVINQCLVLQNPCNQLSIHLPLTTECCGPTHPGTWVYSAPGLASGGTPLHVNCPVPPQGAFPGVTLPSPTCLLTGSTGLLPITQQVNEPPNLPRFPTSTILPYLLPSQQEHFNGADFYPTNAWGPLAFGPGVFNCL